MHINYNANNEPEHFDKCRNASRLKYREQTLAMMWNVVQGTSSAASSLRVQSTAWHGSQESGYHLWWVHDGVTACLLLWQLMDHCDGLADDHLILVVQQFHQLRDCPDCQVGIVLTAFQWRNKQWQLIIHWYWSHEHIITAAATIIKYLHHLVPSRTVLEKVGF